MIRDNLVGDFRGVEFRDIGFTAEGLRRATDIPGILAFEIEGVASRNRSGEPFYIDNTAHPAYAALRSRARARPSCRASASAQPRRQGQQWTFRAVRVGGLKPEGSLTAARRRCWS